MPAVAVPAAIGLGTSIFGGIMGSRAANKAGQLQYQAAQDAMKQMRDALAQTNPQIQSAADQAKADALAAAREAGVNLTGTAAAAGQGVTDAATRANQFLSPFVQAGGDAVTNLAQLMAPGGLLSQRFDLNAMQTMDPGYQFRIDMANKALQSSAAAKGGALGGGALRSLQSQSQNLASSEMQNAFDRWRAQNQDIFGRYNTMATMGMDASGRAGTNLMNAAQLAGGWNVGAGQQAGNWLTQGTQYGGTGQMNAANSIASNTMNTYRTIADLMTGGAAAQAAGTVGSANAWQGALSGVANVGNQIGGYYNQKNMLDWMQQNPGVFANPSLRTNMI